MGSFLSDMRLKTSALGQLFPPRARFDTEQMPDLTGRVTIVTGIERKPNAPCAKALLEHNAIVYMATRNKRKAEEAIAELNERTGRLAIYLELDLSSLSSVKRAAEEFMSKEKKLHILFNNAGVMWSPREMLTAEGYDMQFGTNVLGHFYLTALLMPALLAGRDSSPDGYVRVITTSSSAAYRYTLNWDSFKAGAARRKMSPRTLYCQSKFADVVFARQLAKRYGEKGIVSISCNPGQRVVCATSDE
ncbi:hypothetical protein IEO21_03374 [Rhodonia placenta]|uniref:NAD(P)-binding protein n=1 Tax=Rhodonia placenta TaxID=104341 RepID=A0A8H7U496_9APHY|nr:hypothetical protein IEO21_03374 [Postia placenta]